jgi:hypothetical protein
MSTVVKDRDHLIVAALSLTTVGGVYLDGWAHTSGKVETFFTPWHAVLYSGFLLTSAWVVLLGIRLGGRAAGPQGWWAALPRAYRVGVVGVAIFAAGGAADMFWHTIFGVEAGVDALVSPTHLVLLLGGMLLFSSPAVAAARSYTRSRTATAAIGLSSGAIGAAAAFFFSYLEVFRHPRAADLFIPHFDDTGAILGFGGYLLNTAAIIVPVLLLRRLLAKPPTGVLTMVTAAVAVGGGAFSEFAFPVPIAMAVVGAAIADAVLVAVPWPWDRWLVLGAVGPLFVWSGQLAGVAIEDGIGWTVELWAGIVVLCSLGGLALALLTRVAERPPAVVVQLPVTAEERQARERPDALAA